MVPLQMIAAETSDRGRMFYLVDANLDFIPEVKLFLDWKAATQRAPTTIAAYCSRLLWFYRFLAQQQLYVKEVTPAQLTEFVIWLRHPLREERDKGDEVGTPSPLQPTTVNHILHAVAALYHFMERRHLIPASPILHVEVIQNRWATERDLLAHTRHHHLIRRLELKVKEPTSFPKTISDQEFHTFVTSIHLGNDPAADPAGFRDRLICLLLKEGGFRLGELLGMHLEDLDFGGHGVFVRFRPDNENGARAKSGYGRDRFVHLPTAIMGLLDLYLTEIWIEAQPRTDHLWIVLKKEARNADGVSTVGTALSRSACEKMFQYYSRKSGIHLRPHQLRHTYATELVRSYLREGHQVDWKFVQERLGHASVVTTMQTYTPTKPLRNGEKPPMDIPKKTIGRESPYGSHLTVTLAGNLEAELANDLWDMRRLLPDYPKHCTPSQLIVNFTWIVHPLLRQQVKLYLRQHLAKWKARSFRSALARMKPFLELLPPDVHIGILERSHIEALLPRVMQLPGRLANTSLASVRNMFEYMATAPQWTGPRPPRHLIWPEDIPSEPKTLPRPIPPDVVDQLDALLEKAQLAIEAGQEPPILSAMYWDVMLILRRTGMRLEDLAHLKVPDPHGHNGCLVQDNDGYWWVRIDPELTKMGREHRIPTKMSDGVVAAIRRQSERAKALPDYFTEHYLFRHHRGILTSDLVRAALRKLAAHLSHEGHPYVITAHQFRHTIATGMIEQGIDIYTVKEFLGHQSLEMTERYVKVYLKSLKTKYDAYRAKKESSPASALLTNQIAVAAPSGETDGGWVENRVGTLYRSPLPDGIGYCEHLAMLDPCPTPPHCPTCPKLRAAKRHLPTWENKARNLLITVESLRDNPVYARARQRHEQELRHTEKVIETIKQEGFWDGRIHNT